MKDCDLIHSIYRLWELVYGYVLIGGLASVDGTDANSCIFFKTTIHLSKLFEIC